MKISIYTEAGRNFGYGHIVRCSAIAEAFVELNCEVQFFINGDNGAETFLPNLKYTLMPWSEKPVKDSGGLVIFDSYSASMDSMRKISGDCEVLFIDDFQRLEYPSNSWILNACPGISQQMYPNNRKVFLGPNYLPLRKDFWDIRVKDIRKFGNINRILVMFGGSDIKNLTPITIDYLLNNLPDVQVITIQGRESRSLSELTRLKNIHNRLKLYIQPKIQDLIALMLEADLAISAAGQTLQELAFLGLPTIAIQVAENQSNNLRGWSENKAIVPVVKYDSTNFHSKLNVALEILKSSRTRRKYSYEIMKLVDGQGARRLAKSMMQII